MSEAPAWVAARGARATTAAALLGAALAAIALVPMWGFTVDDAFIPARYAAHLAGGAGYRFNQAGAATDGVTPLPWAPLLAALAGAASVERVWSVARALGAISWLAAVALLGVRALGAGRHLRRFAPLALVAASAPAAAWAAAGLETGVVTALTTLAAAAPFSRRGALVASATIGVAAAFRPELIVFAVFIGAARAIALRGGARLVAVAASVGPWLAVVAVRLVVFGRPAPLALAAKPSDFEHGFAYVVAGTLLAGFPVMLVAPRVLVTSGRLAHARCLALACAAHLAAVCFAGGDWMPLSRLLVPIFPALIVAGFDVSEASSSVAVALRALVAAGAMGWAWVGAGVAATGIVPVRLALIAHARGVFAPSAHVAALDVGWLGAATEATVVDLAGLTDPAIASLPGGHTSKRVPATLLDARGVDALVLLRGTTMPRRADGGPFARPVEERLAADPWVAENFAPAETLSAARLTYVVLRRRAAAAP